MQSTRLQLNTAKTEVVWCVESTATSTTTGHIESWHRRRHADNLSTRPRNLHRLRRVLADPRVQDHVQLLRHITPVAQHSSVDVTSGTTVAGRLAGVVAPGLWQRDARRSTWQPAVMNAAARLVCSARKYEHITPLLRDLHWLRMPERLVFKLSVRCLHGMAPPYLASELRRVADVDTRKTLRSLSMSALVTPSSCRTTIGDGAFFVAAPRVWNTLPSSVTASETLGTFKRRLKTHLFRHIILLIFPN